MGLFHFIFRRMCYHIFNKVDVDNSGYVEAIEVEVAVYRLYNIINKRLPGWQDPPKRSEILKAMKQYDKEGDLRLTKDEFVLFAKQLCKEGPDQFFSRMGKEAMINTAVLPVATRQLQKFLTGSGFKQAGDAPLHYAAPIVGTVFKGVRALLPFGLNR